MTSVSWPSTRFYSGLIGVGNEKTTRGKSSSSLVNTTAPLKLLGALYALFSSQGRVKPRVDGQLRTRAQLQDIIATLRRRSAIAAAGAPSLSTGRIVGGRANRAVNGLLLLLRRRRLRLLSGRQAFGALRRAGQALEASRGAARRGPVLVSLAARTGATASAAAGATVVGACRHHGSGVVVVVAGVVANLTGREAERDTTNANVRLAWGIARNGDRLAVSNLAGSLGGGEASLSASVVAADDLEIGSHLGGALLGESTRILILGTVTPDRGLLSAEEGNVAAAMGRGGYGAARRGAAEIAGRGTVGGRGRLLEAGGAAKCADGGRPTP